VDWNKLAQCKSQWQPHVMAVINIRVTLKSGKNFLINWPIISFSRRTKYHGGTRKLFRNLAQECRLL